jgi:hypothetical protein
MKKEKRGEKRKRGGRKIGKQKKEAYLVRLILFEIQEGQTSLLELGVRLSFCRK